MANFSRVRITAYSLESLNLEDLWFLFLEIWSLNKRFTIDLFAGIMSIDEDITTIGFRR